MSMVFKAGQGLRSIPSCCTWHHYIMIIMMLDRMEPGPGWMNATRDIQCSDEHCSTSRTLASRGSLSLSQYFEKTRVSSLTLTACCLWYACKVWTRGCRHRQRVATVACHLLCSAVAMIGVKTHSSSSLSLVTPAMPTRTVSSTAAMHQTCLQTRWWRPLLNSTLQRNVMQVHITRLVPGTSVMS
jgi:hypothetical protein